MKRLKISKTEVLAVPLPPPSRLTTVRACLLLVMWVLAFALTVPYAFANSVEDVVGHCLIDFKFEACLKAAEQGDTAAQYLLGGAYDTGEGVPRDYQAAIRWYCQAAEQGHVLAQFSLGAMYDAGEGVPRDYQAAVRWYRQAAEQGYAAAQNNLGAMYSEGKGVPRNYIEAYMWYSLAAARSNDKAANNLDLLEKRMTPAQIAAAQERARNWRPSSSSE